MIALRDVFSWLSISNGLRLEVLSEASLRKRLLIPINIASFILLSALGTFLLYRSNSFAEKVLNSKIDQTLSFLANSSQTYILNYDTAALDNIGKEAVKDEAMDSIEFFDKDGKSLSHSFEHLANIKSQKYIQKDLLDPNGGKIASLKIGINYNSLIHDRQKLIMMVIFSTVIVQLALSAIVLIFVNNVITPLNLVVSRLRHVSGDLEGVSGNLNSTGDKIGTVSTNLSAAAEESCASLTQIIKMLENSVSFINECNQRAQQASQKTQNGSVIMQKLSKSMSELEQSNSELQKLSQAIGAIADKTNKINDIVFKTQVLSFNASIEAARAGQHGRGFAVVAEEVGNLARMSGQAADEIGQLVKDSQKMVEQGLKLTEQRILEGRGISDSAVETFHGISEHMSSIADLVGMLHSGAKEQELGAQQVNLATSKLNEMAQQNGDLAFQTREDAKMVSDASKGATQVTAAIQLVVNGEAKIVKKKKTSGHLSKVERILNSTETTQSLAESKVKPAISVIPFPEKNTPDKKIEDAKSTEIRADNKDLFKRSGTG